jgi:hypothetical protein
MYNLFPKNNGVQSNILQFNITIILGNNDDDLVENYNTNLPQ